MGVYVSVFLIFIVLVLITGAIIYFVINQTQTYVNNNNNYTNFLNKKIIMFHSNGFSNLLCKKLYLELLSDQQEWVITSAYSNKIYKGKWIINNSNINLINNDFIMGQIVVKDNLSLYIKDKDIFKNQSVYNNFKDVNLITRTFNFVSV